MGRLILLLVSTIVTGIFVINGYFFGLNEHSTIEILDRLPLLFTPANYVYIIWFVIFALFFYWIYLYFKNQNSQYFITPIQTVLFIISLGLHIFALYLWNYEQFSTSLILFSLQLLGIFLLYLTYPIRSEALKFRVPVAIYFSWSMFLFILKFYYFLVYIEWEGFGLSSALWTVIFMTIGTAIALHLRYHHYDIYFPIVFIWAYIGIALGYGFSELLVSTAALFLSGVMVIGIMYMKKHPARLK